MPLDDWNRTEISQAAVKLVKHFQIFPCLAGSKAPATPNGFHDATNDLTQVEAWWNDEPNANIGMVPASAGLIVLDLDLYKPGGVDPDLIAELPPTRTVASPSGGEHRYYQTTEKFSNGTLAKNVDVRSANGYVLMSPSIVAGTAYRITDDRKPVPLPEWVADRLHAATEALAERKAQTWSDGEDDPDKIAQARRKLPADCKDKPGYVIAAILRRDLGLTGETAKRLWLEWQAGIAWKWEEADIDRLLTNAGKYGQAKPGSKTLDLPHTGSAEETFGAIEALGSPQDRGNGAASYADSREGQTSPSAGSTGDDPVQLVMQDAAFDIADAPIGLAELLRRPIAPLTELVPGWIEANINTYLEGPAEVMKSLSALQDVMCIAAGHPVYGINSIKTKALYLSYEDPIEEIQRRADKITRCLGIDTENIEIWDLKTNPRAILQVKANDEVWITRFGRRFLKYLEKHQNGWVVVFDGIIDAITFEGGTRNSDVVAGQVIREIDRWCLEYNFTGLSILHPSRAGERLGGGSYAPAWTTKPRAIQTFKRRRLDGKPATADTPRSHTFVRRMVSKRSHGEAGGWLDMAYRDGCVRPFDYATAMSPADAAMKAVSTTGDRIKRDRKLGTARLSNSHWLVQQFGRDTGDKGTIEKLMAALEVAEAEGRLVYMARSTGRNREPAGYVLANAEGEQANGQVEEFEKE
jgi:Bifunctional DNA primase/polymerase, N-terminal/AAA domain